MPRFKTFTAQVDHIHILETIEEALKSSEWNKVVEEELSALENNKTWVIIDLPKDKKPVDCKWVFTVKFKADGKIERYKARLVTKGFTYTYGVDYQETFAPVSKLNTIRVILSLVVNKDWILHQLDIKMYFSMAILKKKSICKFHQEFILELTGYVDY
ncbi:uncharacterized mitochondrial protein AtMg00820-like [Hibiscus syriacus]|uniref:uncharacterized mitochondrial protein AtMg00820-like n=1 Tax=Hibiscus syriacus TaxID=106335 RepID=UPI0019243852|nr:uncharacterized mitochondrial protein AtMg00820-like [Hibiscus syriacus]